MLRQVFRLLANACSCIVGKNIETSISLDGTLYRLMTGCLLQNIQLHKLSLGT